MRTLYGSPMGLLLRSYAKKSEDVPEVVSRAIKSIKQAQSLFNTENDLMLSPVLVLVPSDRDCGLTVGAITLALADCSFENVFVVSASGNASSEVLNYGVEILTTFGIRHVVILSNKAIDTLTVPVLENILSFLNMGIKYVGVATGSLKDIVAKGRIQNTCAAWEMEALQKVGGFDSEIGVEEIAPTIRLIRRYGPCGAIVFPQEETSLDIRKSAEGASSHAKIMDTKISRQKSECERLHSDFSFIEGGIV